MQNFNLKNSDTKIETNYPGHFPGILNPFKRKFWPKNISLRAKESLKTFTLQNFQRSSFLLVTEAINSTRRQFVRNYVNLINFSNVGSVPCPFPHFWGILVTWGGIRTHDFQVPLVKKPFNFVYFYAHTTTTTTIIML